MEKKRVTSKGGTKVVFFPEAKSNEQIQKPINIYKVIQKNVLSAKEEQTYKTLEWLDENFTHYPGVCLPRCIMYAHYLTFCQENQLHQMCAATFGKIIRQKFPELTTRRLGTRGNSKYHYYGVAIKESSKYYHTVYSGIGLTRFSGSKLLSSDNASRKILSAAKSGSLLPDFPSPHQLHLPYHVETCKLDTFMVMYRTHCQCLLDTAVAKNYEAIHQYLVHFWQGIPNHLKSLFEVPEIISLICVCDAITFMVLNDSLVPATLEEITDQTLTEVRLFVNSLENWLHIALKNSNTHLLERKMQVARRFVQAVKRQISFLHLAQSFREVLSDKVIAQNLINELNAIDITSIGAQALFTTADCKQDQSNLHEEYLIELRELLKQNATVEEYVDWLERIIKAQVLQYCESDHSFKLRAQEFLLSWSFFGTRVMHMLTLNNSRTYGPFHLIRMMLDEYLLLIIETRLSNQEQFSLQQESEKLIKVSGDKCIKMSEFATMSKFGAPREKPSTGSSLNSSIKITPNLSSLPPIASLQNLKGNSLYVGCVPDTGREVETQQIGGLITLTPPSSPIENLSTNVSVILTDQPKKKSKGVKRKKICNETTSNVSSLVDEHFRNCGVEQFSMSIVDNKSELLQKIFLSQTLSQEKTSVEDFYLCNNDEENNPLQYSFSQILNSDVLFSFDDESPSNDNFITVSEDLNRSTPLQFNFTDNFTGQSIEEVFLRRNIDDDDFSYTTSFLEMSF
ncbi:DNA-binding protein RFX6 isoform X1 [Hydra vulgaris]|uniref:DNA-binding protein RFX6 isoform X1 n=1 Tax=Hydra vulgaris TaxID=6087 RepID=UPI001F5EC957|nr:DNA-binding protein RFX6-like isoform X1 [Hydra vulgaris]XP_047124397.1 DNA-binding protein RFX6-like isoform X2 [Hydra vulgaris]